MINMLLLVHMNISTSDVIEMPERPDVLLNTSSPYEGDICGFAYLHPHTDYKFAKKTMLPRSLKTASQIEKGTCQRSSTACLET